MDVRIVTTRESLPVQPSMLRGGRDSIQVDVCVDCGAILFDALKHVLWHSKAFGEPMTGAPMTGSDKT